MFGLIVEVATDFVFLRTKNFDFAIATYRNFMFEMGNFWGCYSSHENFQFTIN